MGLCSFGLIGPGIRPFFLGSQDFEGTDETLATSQPPEAHRQAIQENQDFLTTRHRVGHGHHRGLSQKAPRPMAGGSRAAQPHFAALFPRVARGLETRPSPLRVRHRTRYALVRIPAVELSGPTSADNRQCSKAISHGTIQRISAPLTAHRHRHLLMKNGEC
jgi:hypothetical protein